MRQGDVYKYMSLRSPFCAFDCQDSEQCQRAENEKSVRDTVESQLSLRGAQEAQIEDSK